MSAEADDYESGKFVEVMRRELLLRRVRVVVGLVVAALLLPLLFFSSTPYYYFFSFSTTSRDDLIVQSNGFGPKTIAPPSVSDGELPPPPSPTPSASLPSSPYDPRNPLKPCQLSPIVDEDVEAERRLAFTMVLSDDGEMPRLYHMCIESFFKHHPSWTLRIIGNLKHIDKRFAEHGFKIEVYPLNLTSVLEMIVEDLPEFESLVLRSDKWPALRAHILKERTVLSDLLRYALLYRFGGTWLDADILVLRPLTFRNSITAAGFIWNQFQRFVRCYKNGSLDASVYAPRRGHTEGPPPSILALGFSVWNSVLGGFVSRHPFFGACLLNLLPAFASIHRGQKTHALGSHLFTLVLSSSKQIASRNSTAPKPHPANITNFEWPNLVHENRMVGEMSGPLVFLERFGNMSKNLFRVLEEDWQSYTFHFGGKHTATAEQMRDVFAGGGFYHSLWLKHCVFSCNEPIP